MLNRTVTMKTQEVITMRLIEAEEFFRRNDLVHDLDEWGECVFISDIENAPAIEPTVDKEYLIRLIQEAVYDGEACARLMDMVEPEWIPVSEIPDTDRNVFIARGTPTMKSCCIGHYEHDLKMWYEDKNFFASPIYDGMYWCEIPPLPEPYTETSDIPDTDIQTGLCSTCEREDCPQRMENIDRCNGYMIGDYSCETCKHDNEEVESIACERCIDGTYSRFEPNCQY